MKVVLLQPIKVSASLVLDYLQLFLFHYFLHFLITYFYK